MSETLIDLVSDPRITDKDLARAVRSLARYANYEPIYREAAVLAAIRENHEALEKSHAAG